MTFALDVRNTGPVNGFARIEIHNLTNGSTDNGFSSTIGVGATVNLSNVVDISTLAAGSYSMRLEVQRTDGSGVSANPVELVEGQSFTLQILVPPWQPGDLTLDAIQASPNNPSEGQQVLLIISVGNPSGKTLPVNVDATPISPTGVRGSTSSTSFTPDGSASELVEVNITVPVGAEAGLYDIEVVLTG